MGTGEAIPNFCLTEKCEAAHDPFKMVERHSTPIYRRNITFEREFYSPDDGVTRIVIYHRQELGPSRKVERVLSLQWSNGVFGGGGRLQKREFALNSQSADRMANAAEALEEGVREIASAPAAFERLD